VSKIATAMQQAAKAATVKENAAALVTAMVS